MRSGVILLVVTVPACTLLAGTSDLRIAADVGSDASLLDDDVVGSAASDAGGVTGGDGATGRDGSSGPNDAAPSSYRDTVLADQPLAYWRMGQVQGSAIADETGRGNSLEVSGTTTAAPGAIADDPDSALAFDGTAAIAYAKDSSVFAFDGVAPFSIEAWVMRVARGNPPNFEHLFGSSTGLGSSRLGYLVYLSNAGGGALQLQWRPAVDTSYTAHGSFPTNGFAHVVSVFDGTSLRLFVDGVSSAPQTVAGALPPRTSSFAVGGDGARPTDSPFSGVIDEVAVYGRALSAAEIAHHFDKGRGPK